MDFETYNIIAGHDQAFELIPTYNINIFKVCSIMTQAAFKTNEERIYYADIGEIPPVNIDAEGNKEFEFDNLYSTKAVHIAAIAEAIFFEFPKVLKRTKKGFVIADTDLNARIDRSQVLKALEDWLGKFNENLYEVKGFLSLLAGSPILANMLMNPVAQGNLVSTMHATAETSKNGPENFTDTMDTGES